MARTWRRIPWPRPCRAADRPPRLWPFCTDCLWLRRLRSTCGPPGGEEAELRPGFGTNCFTQISRASDDASTNPVRLGPFYSRLVYRKGGKCPQNGARYDMHTGQIDGYNGSLVRRDVCVSGRRSAQLVANRNFNVTKRLTPPREPIHIGAKYGERDSETETRALKTDGEIITCSPSAPFVLPGRKGRGWIWRPVLLAAKFGGYDVNTTSNEPCGE